MRDADLLNADAMKNVPSIQVECGMLNYGHHCPGPVYTVSSEKACPEGTIYNPDFNSCYLFMKEPNSYLNAEQICLIQGGRLAFVRSEEENSYITGLVQSLGNPDDLYFWKGLPVTDYTNWASGQSDMYGCPAITPCAGLWASVDCTFSAPYVCRIEPVTCPTCPTCPALHSYCDSTWTYFEETDSCYKGFFNATWEVAEATCQLFDSHLASIHSDAENNFVFDLVTTGADGKFDHVNMTWFGLHRNPPGSNHFEFVDGTEFETTSFNKWAPGEPNFAGAENCVELISDKLIKEKNGEKYDIIKHWNDSICNQRRRRFVCKKPAYHG